METSRRSTLPTFKLGDIYKTFFGPDDNKEHYVVEVMCSRSWCQRTFVVRIDHWWRKNIWETKHENKGKVKTRPCPHCFGVSKMPKKPKGYS